MTRSKQLGLTLGALTLGLIVAELGGRNSVPGLGSYVSSAQAVVGRPMTPVSVAGTARRTTRRCATGVYDC